MNGNYMLPVEPVLGIPYQNRSFIYPRSRLPLHAMISSCGYARETAHYDWDGNRRTPTDFVLIQHTLAGQGRLQHEGRRHLIGPGDTMLLHFPHDNRYYLPASSPGWEFIYVCLHGRWVIDTARQLERTAGPVLRQPPTSPSRQALTTLVHDAFTPGSIDSAFTTSSRAYGLVMAYADELLGSQPEHLQPPFAEKAMRYAREHFAEPIGIADLAAAAGLSRAHFSRSFKAALGVAPVAYIRQLRIEHAMRQLRATSDTIDAVASRCGFRDASYFCRVFRQETGISPDTFRHSGMY